jgi:zinc protease
MKLSSVSSRWLLVLVSAAAATGLWLAPAGIGADAKTDDQAISKIAAGLYDDIRTETLPNGLRVYVKAVANATTVTTMVAYKVGSSDEDKEFTGLSHYLEHLMFKGTEKIFPGDIDRLTLRKGGANNAYTTEDNTIYHFDFAAEHWEVPLRIEADRMRNLRIDARHEFEQEKGAVCAELDRNEDRPWDLELKTILPLLFGAKAPYGHPVIGERKHVHAATAEVIKAYYDKWYHPNNAALVVVGGIDADKVLAKIKELFGPLPKKELPPRKPEVPSPRKGPIKKDFASKFFQPRLLLGYNTCKTGDPDYYALDVIQAVLSSGRTSRLYKKLIEGEEIASSADASNNSGRYPGWFSVQVELVGGKKLDQAEKLVLAELDRLRKEPVSAAELKRVKQQLVASVVFGRESVHDLANDIARNVTVNDLDFLKNYLTKVTAVTPEDVHRVARKYFDPEQRVTIYSEFKGKKDDVEPKGGGGGLGFSTPAGRRAGGQASRLNSDKEVSGANFSLEAAKRVELPNGLTLLLFENRRLPIVVAEALVKDVRLYEPATKSGVATLVGRLLDEGTTKHKGPEIAELIEDTGGALSFSSGGGSVKVLTPYRKLGLSLLFECLSQPTFEAEAFNRQREQLLAEIEDAETKPDARAAKEYRSLVYGKHPFARYATTKSVSALKPEDCRAFHKQVFVPNNTVVAVVGDFDSKQVTEEIKELTANWKKAPLTRPTVSPAVMPEKFTQKVVTMPEAKQLAFYMGHPGIRRNNPDYYKLLVMDYVLGTGPGFTDRLSAAIRDRKGLAYTVRANITSGAGEEPGLFTCYVGTEPKNFAEVKGIFLKELNRIRDEAPANNEVTDAKDYLLGSLPFEFQSNADIAGHLLGVERYGLGLNYLDTYKKAVAAVTPEDVQAVAKKHIDPKHLVLVVAGAVDDAGKPLDKLPPPKEK